jgi:hypothetical protein
MKMKRYAVTVLGRENLEAPLGYSGVWIDALNEGQAKSIMLEQVANDLCRPRKSLMAFAELVKV